MLLDFSPNYLKFKNSYFDSFLLSYFSSLKKKKWLDTTPGDIYSVGLMGRLYSLGQLALLTRISIQYPMECGCIAFIPDSNPYQCYVTFHS